MAGRAAEVQREHEPVARHGLRAAATRCGCRRARTSAPAAAPGRSRGCSAAALDLLDRQRRVTSPGTTIDPRRRGSRSSHCSTSQALTARDERGGGVGVLDRLGAVRRRRGSRPRRPTDRARAARRSSTDPGDSGRRDRGRGAGWSPRSAGRRCRSGPRNWVVARPRASARSSQGKSVSIDGTERVDVGSRSRRRRSDAPQRSRRGFEAERHAVRHRQVEDVALGVVEAAIPVPGRLDDVGRPGRRRAVRTRRSPASRSSTGEGERLDAGRPGARDRARTGGSPPISIRKIETSPAWKPAQPCSRSYGSTSGSPSTSR